MKFLLSETTLSKCDNLGDPSENNLNPQLLTPQPTMLGAKLGLTLYGRPAAVCLHYCFSEQISETHGDFILHTHITLVM